MEEIILQSKAVIGRADVPPFPEWVMGDFVYSLDVIDAGMIWNSEYPWPAGMQKAPGECIQYRIGIGDLIIYLLRDEGLPLRDYDDLTPRLHYHLAFGEQEGQALPREAIMNLDEVAQRIREYIHANIS